MPTKRLSQIVSEMPLEDKLISLGGIFTVLSVFLPWYQDVDAFKTGDQFLGITGPLYLVGVIIFLLGITTVLSVVSAKWRNRIARFGIELPMLRIIVSSFDLFLLVLTNSVYFHAKFGVNIMMKEFRFGMVLAFIGVGLMLIGSIFEYRKGEVKWENIKGESKPLIDIAEERKHEAISEPTATKMSEPEDKESRYPQL